MHIQEEEAKGRGQERGRERGKMGRRGIYIYMRWERKGGEKGKEREQRKRDKQRSVNQHSIQMTIQQCVIMYILLFKNMVLPKYPGLRKCVMFAYTTVIIITC